MLYWRYSLHRFPVSASLGIVALFVSVNKIGYIRGRHRSAFNAKGPTHRSFSLVLCRLLSFKFLPYTADLISGLIGGGNGTRIPGIHNFTPVYRGIRRGVSESQTEP